MGRVQQSEHVRTRAFDGFGRTCGRAAVCLAAAAALAPACGLPSVTPGRTTGPGLSADPPSSSRSPKYPNEAAFGSPIERLIYRGAYDQCAISGIQGAAIDYGGDEGNLASIATAYAQFTNADNFQPAYQGCLDALRSEASG
jgi:hypothetical protein